MTINFPKFPHDRRDKTLSPNPNLPDTTMEAITTEPDEAQAHNRSHQEMLKQTEYLDDVQIAEIKAQLIATPKKIQKKLPLVPFFIGLLLLIGGGAMGYMYQEYNRPAPPAPVQATPVVKPAPVATPSQPTSAVAVTNTTVATSSVAVATNPPPITTSTSIMNANTPRANPTPSVTADNKITTVPISAPAPTAPASNSAPNPANTPSVVEINNSNLPPANPSATNPPPPVNVANNMPNQQQSPTSQPSADTASQAIRKSQASYEDFVKKSESTIYVDHLPAKK